jgi:hypothetical protein
MANLPPTGAGNLPTDLVVIRQPPAGQSVAGGSLVQGTLESADPLGTPVLAIPLQLTLRSTSPQGFGSYSSAYFYVSVNTDGEWQVPLPLYTGSAILRVSSVNSRASGTAVMSIQLT